MTFTILENLPDCPDTPRFPLRASRAGFLSFLQCPRKIPKGIPGALHAPGFPKFYHHYFNMSRIRSSRGRAKIVKRISGSRSSKVLYAVFYENPS